jgi:toxin ParE1/3/4
MDETEYISDNFEHGKSMEHIRTGYKATKVKSHLIFYKKTSKDNVEIIRVLRQRMDIENQLND